jgi:hypothetical protein
VAWNNVCFPCEQGEETIKGEASKNILLDQQLREALQELSNLQTELQVWNLGFSISVF